jgi:hypothetical protein
MYCVSSINFIGTNPKPYTHDPALGEETRCMAELTGRRPVETW